MEGRRTPRAVVQSHCPTGVERFLRCATRSMDDWRTSCFSFAWRGCFLVRSDIHVMAAHIGRRGCYVRVIPWVRAIPVSHPGTPRRLGVLCRSWLWQRTWVSRVSEGPWHVVEEFFNCRPQPQVWRSFRKPAFLFQRVAPVDISHLNLYTRSSLPVPSGRDDKTPCRTKR